MNDGTDGQVGMLQAPWALVAAGVITGALVVDNPVGLGVTLSSVAIGLAVEWQRPRPHDPWTLATGALAVALAATALLSAAEWSVALALLAAAGCAAASVTQPTTWAGLVRGLLSPLRSVWEGGRGLTAGIGRRVGRDGLRRAAPALRGAALAAILVVVFGTLFVSADRAFADLTDRYLVPDWDLGLLPARVVVAGFTALGAAALAIAPGRAADAPTAPPRSRLGKVEWLTALGALDLLFVAFVAVQLTVLFGGHTHVLETTGLTYAAYARGGFFQLLVAAGLTFAVIAGAVRWSAADEGRDRLVLRLLLGVVCLLTLVVLASAMRRLGLYEEAFGFTRARMLAHAILLWMAGLIALVLVAGALGTARWLARAAFVVTAVAVLAFTAIRPDALVAEHNVRRFEATGEIDLHYLDTLSADAVPALVALPPGPRACILWDDAARLLEPAPWHAVNLSRTRARRLLREADVRSSPARCHWVRVERELGG
ncbi:MAG: DUF4153 domain-containing protein [Nitriliruptorales bacterium]